MEGYWNCDATYVIELLRITYTPWVKLFFGTYAVETKVR